MGSVILPDLLSRPSFYFLGKFSMLISLLLRERFVHNPLNFEAQELLVFINDFMGTDESFEDLFSLLLIQSGDDLQEFTIFYLGALWHLLLEKFGLLTALWISEWYKYTPLLFL